MTTVTEVLGEWHTTSWESCEPEKVFQTVDDGASRVITPTVGLQRRTLTCISSNASVLPFRFVIFSWLYMKPFQCRSHLRTFSKMALSLKTKTIFILVDVVVVACSVIKCVPQHKTHSLSSNGNKRIWYGGKWANWRSYRSNTSPALILFLSYIHKSASAAWDQSSRQCFLFNKTKANLSSWNKKLVFVRSCRFRVQFLEWGKWFCEWKRRIMPCLTVTLRKLAHFSPCFIYAHLYFLWNENSWCGEAMSLQPQQQRRCVVTQPCRVADWSSWETPQQGCRGDDDQVIASVT